MTDPILKKVEELFSTPGKFTPENMEGFVQDALRFFSDLRTKIASPDAATREEAMKAALELKTKLEQQMTTLCESLGMDPQAIEAYINTSSNFSVGEWQSMEKAKQELDSYKNDVAKMDEEAATPRLAHKKPKVVKDWLVG